jgi:GDP-L-fucose synthase
MHVDDLAEAIAFAMNEIDAQRIYDQGISHLNVGTGTDLENSRGRQNHKGVVGFSGEIVRDESKPDGTMQKLLDVTRMHDLGWQHRIELREGLERVYDWYLRNIRATQQSVPE